MQSMKLQRLLLLSVASAAAIFVIASLGLWLFLSSWVPVKGKTLLIHEVERHAPV